MPERLREINEGDIFHTHRIKKRLDDITTTFYRNAFESDLGILIVYDKTLTPFNVTIEDEGNCVPYEYYVLKHHEELFLPILLDDGSDSKFLWFLIEKQEGVTLSEYVSSIRTDEEHPASDEDMIAMCKWIITSARYMWKCSFHTGLLLTPDCLLVSQDEEGQPQLSICNVHNALSPFYGIHAPFFGAEAKYLAPEFLLGEYDEDSFTYNVALLVVFCLYGNMPGSDFFKFRSYDDIATIQIQIEYNISQLNISKNRKQALLSSLGKDPKYRPTYDAFSAMWDTDSILSNGKQNNLFTDDMLFDDLPQTCSTKFDNMFIKSSGNGFNEIGGMGDLKKMLTEKYINPIKYPEIAKIYNLTPPNGILLYGPPGCGKSFIAKKLCEELDCFYTKVKSSDLGGCYHREGVSNIGSLFAAAEKKSKEEGVPVVLIFDECDGFIQVRNQEMSPGAAAETNMFLTELENCSDRGIYVICTTNDPSGIDSAALRTGRIGEAYYVPLPDDETKKEIFDLNLSTLPHHEIDLRPIIGKTAKFTSSDIAQAVALAASKAMSMMIKNLPSTEVVMIDEDMISAIISDMVPSLSAEDIARHNKIHNRFSKDRKESRQKIGFNS